MSLGTFCGILAVMFVLELPDKTMISTVVMSTRSRPGSIVAGASAAFVIQMGVAVGAGGLLSLAPAHARDAVVATVFLLGGAYLLASKESTSEASGSQRATRLAPGSRLKEIATAFTVIFVAEFGDLTQIQAANFTLKTREPLEVFLAGSIALIAVSFLGAYGGRWLQRRVTLSWIRKAGGLIFVGLGLATLIELATS